MDFIDRMLLRVLAWPGAKTYWSCEQMRERLREITGQRTVIGDHYARLERLRDRGFVLRRQKGRSAVLWNITPLGLEQLCRSVKGGSSSTDA